MVSCPDGSGLVLIEVGLVDDHALLRQGLAGLLAGEKDIEVVWEAADAEEAVACIQQRLPDVVIMDVTLPGRSGIVATRELVKSHAARVLVLTASSGTEFVVQALVAGAVGFALKSQPFEEITVAVRTVAQGKLYLAPKIPREALDEYHRRIRGTTAGVLDGLSNRERGVFELVVQNRSNRAIAKELGISVKTVETHRMSINRKLGVHSSAELVRLAALHGLITS